MVFYVGENSEYKTINEVLTYINGIEHIDGKEEIVIMLEASIYHERVEIKNNNVTLIGIEKTGNKPVITYGAYAKEIMPEGDFRGTFRTATFFVHADNFKAENVIFENSAGSGKEIGQAIACFVDGNAVFENCEFRGHQDTLFTAPLPMFERQKGGFKGPTEFTERRNNKQKYMNCYIEGDVDFIFGGAAAWFENCEIKSLKRPETFEDEIQGYVTAASTFEGNKYGYIFYKCNFTSDCPKDSCYLGRPWRDFAKVSVIDCKMSEHIKPEGFCGWGKSTPEKSTCFMECFSERENMNLPDFVLSEKQEGKEKIEKYMEDAKVFFA